MADVLLAGAGWVTAAYTWVWECRKGMSMTADIRRAAALLDLIKENDDYT